MYHAKIISIFLLVLISAINCCVAATTTISNLPLGAQTAIEPNIIFIMDDSGSMDFEVLLHTSDGALWWDSSVNSFTDNTGTPWFNNNGQPGADGAHYWYKYPYLFPNGLTSDARVYDDETVNHFAIAPIPAYAFVRSSDYNPLYYNPMINYSSWVPAYVNNQALTFTNSVPTAARSHPVFPLSGTPVTMNLSATQFSTTANWTFRMLPGMIIPGATISGIQGSKNGGAFTNVTTNYTIKSGETWDVAIPYYPATYYNLDSTCTSGYPSCATAPDGRTLRRYQIMAGNTFPSGRSYANELQNFANWFTYYRKRKLMLSGALGPVLAQLTSVRGGFLSFNNLVTVPMYDFNNPSPSQNWQALLGQIYQNPANSGTPTRDALNYAGNQFMTNTNIIQYGCQVNASIIMTDGFANVTFPTVPSYNSATWGGTAPYTTTYAQSLADIALAYYTINLRPDLPPGLVPVNTTNTAANADTNPNLHMITYALGLGVEGTIFGTGTPQALNPYANPPTWPNPNTSYNLAEIDDLWHATINSRGLMFSANNANLASTFLQTILGDVFLKAGASSSVGLANVNINSQNNIVYASSYTGNYGDLNALAINTSTGQITATPLWSARTLLDTRTPTNRSIATYNGASGIPFQWTNLPIAMQLQLNSTVSPPGPTDGQTVLNWVRGDQSLEGISYRSRAHFLGDIVDSAPIYVAGAVATYADAGYSSFTTSIASRAPTLYEGANDGMLHAFDAATGIENWAYVPRLIFGNLQLLANKTYTHHFFVDGTPFVGDVVDSSSTWHTLLVGGLRAGGNGYYALDITTPSGASDTLAASKVLWEFPNLTTIATEAANVGLSFGQPIIVKTVASGWVVLVTSGYNNTSGDGKGHLFVLNAMTGALIKDIPTTSGTAASPSGLAQISAFAKNAQIDATIDYVYGGDLNGNVWRFDLSGSTVASWNVSLLATLVDSSGNPQPVTTAPELWQNGSQRMVFVGTGQLLGTTDLTTTQTQTMYGLVDNMTSNPTITPLRSKLKQQTFSNGSITNTAINFSTFSGWYFDLPGSGERVTSDPILAIGVLVFNTNVPNATSCTSKSFQYAIDPTTGGNVLGGLFNGFSTAQVALGTNLSSKPMIVVLPNGQVESITHNADNTTTALSLPTASSTHTAKKVAWREVFT